MGEEVIISAYESFLNSVPKNYQFFIPIILFTLIFVLYSFYSLSFYKLLAKRDILELNLKKYNLPKKHNLYPFLSAFLFILEYLIKGVSIIILLCLKKILPQSIKENLDHEIVVLDNFRTLVFLIHKLLNSHNSDGFCNRPCISI